jgi:EAL domain-containing protein (putative c-di-GMP-specific phosphodiesterase class I)
VETEEQYRLLKNAGCELIQGYHFSRPVPPEEFALLIEKELKERESDAQNGADQTRRNESC